MLEPTLKLFLLFLLAFLLYKLLKFVLWNRRNRFPPGPTGWPIIGACIPPSHMSLFTHADEYGEVSGYRMLGTSFVVLNTIESIRDALQSPRTADVLGARYPSFYKDHIVYPDIIMRSMGEDYWKQLRQVLHSALRKYDEGVTEIERVISQELDHVKSLLRSKLNDAVDIEEYLAPSIQNTIYTLLNGERYDYDDPVTRIPLEAIAKGNYLATPLIEFLLRSFPFIRFLPGKIGDTFRFVQKSVKVILDVSFEQCRDVPSEIRRERKGVSYELLRQLERYDWLTLDFIRGCVQDVHGAGNITSKTSLQSFFLIILHYPDVQQRIQDEIDENVSRDRNPSLSDRPKMPYTVASILELLRYTSSVALSIPHACEEDTQFRGVTIPKGAIVFPNLFRVHHDEKHWRDPWRFDPSRFLDENGCVLAANHPVRQNFIPFGVGKRMCMGEVFAKTRLFLYVSNLLQLFTFLPFGDFPSCDPRTYFKELVIHPPSFKLKVVARDPLM